MLERSLRKSNGLHLSRIPRNAMRNGRAAAGGERWCRTARL